LDDVRKQLFSAENVVLHPDRSDRGLSTLVNVPEAEADADADADADTMNEVD
jgi:hypothetical protein